MWRQKDATTPRGELPLIADGCICPHQRALLQEGPHRAMDPTRRCPLELRRLPELSEAGTVPSIGDFATSPPDGGGDALLQTAVCFFGHGGPPFVNKRRSSPPQLRPLPTHRVGDMRSRLYYKLLFNKVNSLSPCLTLTCYLGLRYQAAQDRSSIWQHSVPPATTALVRARH